MPEGGNELQPAPAKLIDPKLCPEKQQLIEAYMSCVSEYLKIQSAQVNALIMYQAFDPDLEAEIEATREYKVAAKVAVIAHQKEHRC
jgi:hypothetical protein